MTEMRMSGETGRDNKARADRYVEYDDSSLVVVRALPYRVEITMSTSTDDTLAIRFRITPPRD